MKVAYWPGCVSRGFTPELHGSMGKVAPLLDIELIELDRAACCGAGAIAEHSQELADTLNARTFALDRLKRRCALLRRKGSMAPSGRHTHDRGRSPLTWAREPVDAQRTL